MASSSSSGKAGGGLAHGLLAAVALVLFVGGVYAGRLDGPFVFDDEEGIVNNRTIRSLRTAWSPPANTPLAARPVPNLTLALNHALSGDDPGGYHRFNLGLHCANVLLAFLLLSRLLSHGRLPEWIRIHSGGIAFAAAAVWGSHPATVEVVLYTVQRTESCMALFYLATIYAAVRVMDAPRPGPWQLAAWIAFLGGIASKEVVATAPILALMLDRAFFAGSLGSALRQRRTLWIGFAACYLPLVLLQAGSPRAGSVKGPSLHYLAAQSEIVPEYLAAVFVPGRHVLDYGMLVRDASYGTWVSILATGLLVLGCLALAWTHPRVGFIGAWFFGILAPSSTLVTVATEIGAERRIYLPLLALVTGVVILAAAALRRIPLPGVRARTAIAAIHVVPLLIVLALLAAGTRERTESFVTEQAFWQSAVRQRPQNPRAHYNLGERFRQANDLEQAAESYARAVEVYPHYRSALVNLGGALIRLQRVDEAIEHLTLVSELDSERFNARYNLGIALMLRGDLEQALIHFAAATRIRPDHPGARRRHDSVRALLEKGDTPD